MNNKRIFYSCCTKLAYEICQWYYGQKHYVWCSPYYDGPSRLSPYNSVAPSSNPREIYWNLLKDVKAADSHSIKINNVRSGILRGADVKLNEGIINASEYSEILEIVRLAQAVNFTPLMLVIPVLPIAGKLRLVPVKDRASLLSEEYIIENLPRYFFDAIEL